MSSNIEEKIKFVMAAVFGVNVDEINDESSPHTIRSWDSMKHINLVVALEQEFGVELEDDEIEAMVSYPVVSATIQAYLD